MAALYFKDKEIQGNLNYISVEGETINNQNKTIEITEKGSYEVTYDEGYTGLEKVNIDVNIQGGLEVVDGTNIRFQGSTFTYFPQQYVPLMNSTTNYEAILKDCNKLVTFTPQNLNTSNVTNMNSMFNGCLSLTSLDLSNFDTSNVTNMNSMFYYCKSLTSLDLSGLDTSKVTNMGSMFYNCYGLTSLDLSSFNTSKVTDIGTMFYDCKSLTSLDLSGWDTSKVTTFDNSIYTLFSSCSSLEKVDGFLDMSSVKNKLGYNETYAFINCSKLRKLEFRNLGTQSNFTQAFFVGGSNGLSKWGEDTEEIPDARESMINTLITYSFDRAAAGYSTCTIKMQSSAKARLTEDEIAQITSKGYTIA